VTGRPRAAVTGATVLLTGALSAWGLWLRARNGPLWPALLADWSLGSALLAMSSAMVGAVLTTRVRRNLIGWLFLAQGPLTAVVFVLRQSTTLSLSADPGSDGALWTAWAFAWLVPVNMTLLSLLLMLFPFGRGPSRRWRPVVSATAVSGVAAAVATMVSPYLPDQTPFPHLRNPAALLDGAAGRMAVDITAQALLLGLIAGAVALAVRVRRARGSERQQLKWFLFAALVAVATFITGFWLPPLSVVATLIALPAVPLAAGLAVLRYRLYDIDRVINRTVVYGVVSAILAVAYLLTVATLRSITAAWTGDSALAVAASTLAVAALFSPLRRRVQSAVDRRFNRARYDAVATVDGLRTRLRDEVDLESLKAELVSAVCATMQPAGTTLWLREAKR
jgi:hypothetical protein